MVGMSGKASLIDVSHLLGSDDRLTWRPTWPFGCDDDFVADLPERGWARVRRIMAGPHADEWRWSIESAGERGTGWEEGCDAAMAAVDAHVFPH